MRAQDLEQARMLVRLRAARLDGASRALALARHATAAAETARDAADARSADADVALDDDRRRLAADPDHAATRLALVDQARFNQALARSALNDATEEHRLCDAAESDCRRTLIHAQARHGRLAERVTAIANGLAGRREEQAAIEAIEGSRR